MSLVCKLKGFDNESDLVSVLSTSISTLSIAALQTAVITCSR